MRLIKNTNDLKENISKFIKSRAKYLVSYDIIGAEENYDEVKDAFLKKLKRIGVVAPALTESTISITSALSKERVKILLIAVAKEIKTEKNVKINCSFK